MKTLFYTLLILLCFDSCIKDKPQEPIKTAISIDQENKVLIINEGNFGWGNASISLFDPSSNTVIEDYYKGQNNSTIGDVCQSITKYNNSYYIVVNNSNKIIVSNVNDFKKTALITGFNSPRYLLPITYNKAYVSDLYSSTIHIVNLNSNLITGSIPCIGWTESMSLIYNKAFITNVKTNYCYVINTVTDIITDSINIGKGASSIGIDKNSKVWILTNGSITDNQNGKLVRINPISLQVEQTFNFSSSDNPSKLYFNKTHDTLYYLNNGVYQCPITINQLPPSPLINQGSKLYYGLGINPKNYTIYVSDAIDYVQKSKIELYSPNGNFKSSFNAGIISGDFMFE